MPYVGRLFKSKTVSYRGAKLAQFGQSMGFKRAQKTMSSRMAAVVPISSRKKKHYGQEGPEVKFFDVSTDNIGYSATGQVYDMSTMAQGITNITRIANKIKIISAAYNLTSEPSLTTTVQYNHHRWAVVLDKEPELAAIASFNQIYTDNSDLAFRNVNYSDRFVVLKEGRFDSGGVSVVATASHSEGETSWSAQGFVPTDINAKYLAAGAVQASVGSNQLLFVIISHTTDGNASYDLRTRVRYTDE